MRGQFFKQYFAAILRSIRSFHPISIRGLSAGLFGLGLCASPLLLGACSDAAGPLDPEDYYSQGTSTAVLEPIGFSDKKYGERGEDSIDFQSESSIAEVLALFDSTSTSFTWYGFSPLDPFPVGDERGFGVICDPFENPRFPQPINKIEELPTVIEGVVTLHPRFFQKVRVCGEDQRYYGVYFLQDDTGGIMILKDSRVADFTFGERVRLRVRGLMKSYDSYAVLTFDKEEVVEPGTKHDIYFEERTVALTNDDIGQVRRVTGTIISEPTSTNFNEMFIRDENGVTYAASVDRELAQRNIGLEDGMRVQLTGPVVNSYSSLVVLISSKGQIEWLDE